jgi:hypothetical protein
MSEDEDGGELAWRIKARRLIKGEMGRREMTYADLAEALAATGLAIRHRVLLTKVNRATFSAAFLLRCLAAMNVAGLRLAD